MRGCDRLRLLFGLLLVAACSAPEPSSSDEPGASEAPLSFAEPHHHELDVDWMKFDESELYASSEAIVRGRVIAQRRGQHRTYPYDPALGRTLTAEEAGDDYAELPLTISTVEVSERLFAREATRARGGQRIERGARIEIVQLGGRYEHGCFVVPNDQPLLAKDDDVIVFVKPGMIPHATSDAQGMFSIVGGQQGLLPLKAGLAAPIPDTLFVAHAGRPVAELGAEIARRARR